MHLPEYTQGLREAAGWPGGTKHRSPAAEARQSGTWSYECELSVRFKLDSDNGSEQRVQCGTCGPECNVRAVMI